MQISDLIVYFNIKYSKKINSVLSVSNYLFHDDDDDDDNNNNNNNNNNNSFNGNNSFT